MKIDQIVEAVNKLPEELQERVFEDLAEFKQAIPKKYRGLALEKRDDGVFDFCLMSNRKVPACRKR